MRASAVNVRRSSCTRLLAACLASLLIYAVAFGFILDRPLTLGDLQHQINAKLLRAATIPGPKLVILAGSNGAYSHRCETIEPILGMPCVNGGVAVGIGLDYLFARWQHVLHAGDFVYLPMEEAQYVRARAATVVGPDAAIMFRHDWRTLAALPPERWLAALFSFDLRAALMGPIEAALIAAHFHDPRPEATGTTKRVGRSHWSHGRTRRDQPGSAGDRIVIPCLGRTDQNRLWHHADRRVFPVGRSAWRARHRWPANRVRRRADAGCSVAGHPIRIRAERRRLHRFIKFQPLSALRVLRYWRTPERDVAGRALEAARRAAARALRTQCSSSSCWSSRPSGTT